jgi:hypothetical protein
MNNQSIYKVQIYDPSGNLVVDLTGLDLAKQIIKTRNDADQLQVQCSLDKMHELAVTLGTNIRNLVNVRVNELRIYKISKVTGEFACIGAGQIQSLQRGLEDGNRTVVIVALGWLGLLARYYYNAAPNQITINSALDYSAGTTDGGQIALALLANAQAAQYAQPAITNITVGTVQTSNDQTCTYLQFKCIKDALTELTEMEGSFDMEITWDKILNIYYPGIGTTRPDIPIMIPGTPIQLTVTDDGTNLANNVIGQGSGTLEATGTNTASQQSDLGLQTTVNSYSDITNQDMLQSQATADATALSSVIIVPELVLDGVIGPDITQINIGDQLVFRVAANQDSFEDLDGNNYRVESYTWTVDDSNTEQLSLTLAG